MKKRLLLTAVLFVLIGAAGVAAIYALSNKWRRTIPYRMTESSAHGLRNAIRQFYLQYSSYPLSSDSSARDVTFDSTKPLMDVLLGANTRANPRLIQFGEWRDAGKGGGNGIVGNTQSAKFGSLVDLWGNPFRIVVDSDESHEIANPEPDASKATLRQTVLVYSAGPDGDYGSWHDNVVTW